MELETYEWDSTWIEHTEETGKKRVFYIGDSISNALRRECTAASGNEILFDGFASSKAVDNDYLCDSLRLFAGQLPSVSAVLFNSGLHGWHLADDSAYPGYYEKTINFLQGEFPSVPVIPVLTTRHGNGEFQKRVLARNEAVKKIAERLSLPVIDLFTESQKYADCQLDDCHFNGEANKKLAAFLVCEVKKYL